MTLCQNFQPSDRTSQAHAMRWSLVHVCTLQSFCSSLPSAVALVKQPELGLAYNRYIAGSCAQ